MFVVRTDTLWALMWGTTVAGEWAASGVLCQPLHLLLGEILGVGELLMAVRQSRTTPGAARVIQRGHGVGGIRPGLGVVQVVTYQL